MSVSIIIPAFNAGLYIKEAINSILSTNTVDLEVIIIDDGSTDNTKEIIYDEFIHDFRVSYSYQKNQGQSVARNKGLLLANKKFVLFLDSDDYYRCGAVDELYNECESDDLDLLLFEADKVYEYTGQIDIQFDYKRPNNKGVVYRSTCLFNELIKLKKFNVSPCLYMVKRSALVGLHFFPGIHYEDNLFTFLLFMKDLNRCKILNVKCYFRRIRNDSIMTGIKSEKHLNGYYNVYKSVKRFIGKNKRKLDVETLKSCLEFRARLLYKVSISLGETKLTYTRLGCDIRFFLLSEFFSNFKYLSGVKHKSIVLLPDLYSLMRFLRC